jgi:acyl carrier protein
MDTTKAEIAKKVEKIVLAFDKVSPELFAIDNQFMNMGLDSLDCVELIMKIEDEIGVNIPDDDAEKLTTPNAVIDYIYKEATVK